MSNTQVVSGTWIEFTGWAGFKLLANATWKLVRTGSSIVIVPKSNEVKTFDQIGVQ